MGSSLSSEAARSNYDQVLLPKVGFVLPQCSMKPNQLAKIEAQVQRAHATKCGFNRNMALEIRYGPKELGGAGFVHFETLQGEGQILNFLKHWMTDSIISKTLKSTLAWAQFVAGIEAPILEHPDIELPWLEGRLINSMRTFMKKTKCSIEVDNPFVPARQRVNDEYLMDIARHWDGLTSKERELVNYCRLYLQAVTVSDITLACGRRLDPAFVCGSASISSSQTKWLHINQDRPDNKTWKVWMKFMKHVQNQLKRKPLGKWLLPSDELRRQWPVYLDPVTNELFVRSVDGFLGYRLVSDNTYEPTSGVSENPPSESHPVKARMGLGDRWHVLSSRPPTLARSKTRDDYTTFDEYIASLDEWERQLLSCLEWQHTPSEVATVIHKTMESGDEADGLSLKLVGDGSKFSSC